MEFNNVPVIELTSDRLSGNRMEQSVYALLRTRDMAIARYKEFGVPTQWMLDTGLVGKVTEVTSLYCKFISEVKKVEQQEQDNYI